MNKKTIALFEIYLFVMFSVSFAYVIGKTNDLGVSNFSDRESKFISKLRESLLNSLSGGLVSAQSLALWTCQSNVNGSACQEYPSTTCNSVCTTNCFPGMRNNFVACNLGTCFDPVIGTCSSGTPKFLCEQQLGQWSANSPTQCNRECCLINPNGNGGAAQAQFTTEQQCNYLGQSLGTQISFVQVQGEVECLLKASSQERGACVLEFLPELQKYNCETTTQSDCITSGGDFYSGQLCTHPSLNTKCERTQNTKCFEELDGVYYIDSCNNRANIYDSSKLNDVSYWSNIIPITQSCLVGATGTSITNQASCGNCNYLLGSICGTPQRADIPASYGSYICRDLSCVDEWGDERQNGESWCAFDGRIGLDGSAEPPALNSESLFSELPIESGETWCITGGIATITTPPTPLNPNITIRNETIPSNLADLLSSPYLKETICSNETEISRVRVSGSNNERSVDLPGSRHYRKICLDGEVRTEPCGEGRSEVCAQNTQPNTGYTSASCRVNTWQMCLPANKDEDTLNKCEENPDCFLKHVGVGKSYKFDVCIPQYPPGLYNSEDIATDDESYCSMASQECTYIEKKKIRYGGLFGPAVTYWKCILNCQCKTNAFVNSMNNFCSSLGDCGGKINLNGDFTHDGYGGNYLNEERNEGGEIPRLDDSYISEMQSYKTPIQGQSADVLNNSQLAAIFGMPESNFEPDNIHATFASLGIGAVGLLHAGKIASILGDALGFGGETAAAAKTITAGTGTGGAGAGGAAAGTGTGGAGAGGAAAGTGTGGAGAGGAAAPAAVGGSFVGALQGAAIGAAVGYILGEMFGLEGDAMTAVMVLGAAGGALVGAGAFGSAAAASFLAMVPVLIIIIIIILILFKIFGIGEMRERYVQFKCLPWQPPVGGEKCNLCNSDDLPCTKYKCETFGKNCRYLNEGTGNEICINIAPDDTSPPQIDINNPALSSGFSYVNPQTNIGVKIKNTNVNDGCLQEYSSVNFGILLNEPGQCKISGSHTDSYDDMEDYFSRINENNLAINQTTSVAMPTLDILDVSGADPARRGNYKLYVRCQDASGNSNVAEYIVEFCVSPANDITAPSLSGFSPVSPGLVGLNATNKQIQFYTNEPATCRWDLTAGKDYSQMENPVQCHNELNQITLYGWSCQTNLPISNATTDTTNYYFRCADQPWLGNNATNPNIPEEGRNANGEDKIYQLTRTTTPLTITSISPNANIYVGSVPHNVNLEVRTAGGINNGNALCSFSYAGTTFSPFFSTGTNIHTQQNLQLFPGNYDLGLQCVDSAQNIANGNAQFSIEVDSNGPMITHIYNAGAYLNIVTNEPSTCVWSNNACSFEFANGTLLSGSNLLHTMQYNNGITYRIKCKDAFNNIGTCMSVTGGY